MYSVYDIFSKDDHDNYVIVSVYSKKYKLLSGMYCFVIDLNSEMLIIIPSDKVQNDVRYRLIDMIDDLIQMN